MFRVSDLHPLHSDPDTGLNFPKKEVFFLREKVSVKKFGSGSKCVSRSGSGSRDSKNADPMRIWIRDPVLLDHTKMSANKRAFTVPTGMYGTKWWQIK